MGGAAAQSHQPTKSFLGLPAASPKNKLKLNSWRRLAI
jgi:hypothetical protein